MLYGLYFWTQKRLDYVEFPAAISPSNNGGFS